MNSPNSETLAAPRALTTDIDMTIVLTKASVERIILERLSTEFPGVTLNSVDIKESWQRDYCIVSRQDNPA